MPDAAMKPQRTKGAASLVFAGMLLSKIAGFVRQRYIGGSLGTSVAADAFAAAFRIPNFLQNLFGEGVLSASFIPVYASLVARGEEEEAGRVAGAVFAILALVTSLLVAIGMLTAPWLVDLIANGAITCHPATGHSSGPDSLSGCRTAGDVGMVPGYPQQPPAVLSFLQRFGAVERGDDRRLMWFGPNTAEDRMAHYISWASVAGSAIQFIAQLPVVLSLVPALRIGLATHLGSVRTVIRNFGPVFVSRGVVQISAYIDQILAAPVKGGMAMLGYMVTLYLLPVSLFGMSVSASELPAMSSAIGSREEIAAYLRTRLVSGLRRISFFVVPSAVAFVVLGDTIVGTVFQGHRFTAADTNWGWGIMAGSAVGLLAQTQGRLYSSTFYALKDTRTPLRFAMIRIALTAILGYVASKYAPGWLGLDVKWGNRRGSPHPPDSADGSSSFCCATPFQSRRIGKVSVGPSYLRASGLLPWWRPPLVMRSS